MTRSPLLTLTAVVAAVLITDARGGAAQPAESPRPTRLVLMHSELRGVGIDEDTALLVTGGQVADLSRRSGAKTAH
ncbi:MAG TPA: hypothetical protein VEQ10_10960 [Vicinamibacteria bacterium]|nr:hypothetical protein [Vicinamibacteria bacterium]